ncbi:hypothetical protein SAMN05444920_102746 [Nonomuraea solani]|uniref:Peptidase inhibitor family I36 n=1 Tax=Nonomuraea solani TaxID=1144553 RepID=A0A1H5ZMN6_9ACTN|nr:hypothetical protein [Nonomuraea solani]SEG37015.1 hypothetical protein SAMN05444920_102746 [Nonomuraea solani]
MRKLMIGAALATGLAVLAVPSAANAAGPGFLDYSCGPRVSHERATAGTTKLASAQTSFGYVHLDRSRARIYKGRHVYFALGGGLQSGDKITLDWSDTGGRTWHGCYAKRRGTIATAGGVDQWGGRSFRACVYSVGRWVCTPWKK